MDSVCHLQRTEKKYQNSKDSENIVESILSEEVPDEKVSENIGRDVAETTPVDQEKTAGFQEGNHNIAVEEKPSKPLAQPKVRKINIKKAIIYSEILRRPYE